MAVYRLAVLIISDKGSRGEREDASGAVIAEILAGIGNVEYYNVIPDEVEIIKEQLISLCDHGNYDLVLTSGGTGFSERDVTPEATRQVIEKQVPGIPVAMMVYGLQRTPRAMLSRAVAGIRKKTLIINLPGSPKGVRESLEAIVEALPHGLEVLSGRAFECADDEKKRQEKV